MAPFITEMSQSHHARFSICQSFLVGNDIEQILQDYQPQLHMEGRLCNNTFAPIMAPLPIVTPDKMQD